MSNEQWKESGNCKECRRKNYCKAACKVHKIRIKQELTYAVVKEIFNTKKEPEEK